MDTILDFLNVHYKAAIKLVDDFDVTKSKRWDSKDYLNELYVQLGHVYNVLDSNDRVNEAQRKLDNLGDELSDVILQLISLANYLTIDMYEISSLRDYHYDNINGLSILLGQLSEVIMEMNSCRFKKNREGFVSSFDFVKNRIFKLFIITFQIAEDYHIDMIQEFSAMLEDANRFLKRFSKNGNIQNEFIDVYDEQERLLGYSINCVAHEKKYWHRTFGSILYYRKMNKVCLNYDENGKLEVTCEGHYRSGEDLSGASRMMKEALGFPVSYDDLVFLEKRKDNNENEFQYYYSYEVANLSSLPSNFLFLDIDQAISLLQGKMRVIKERINHSSIVKMISYDDFSSPKEMLDLLTKLQRREFRIKFYYKLYRLYQFIEKEKRLRPEKYYFDQGLVIRHKDYKKGNLNYSVILLNTDQFTNSYSVFLLIFGKRKTITQMLKKDFSSKRGTIKYFNELSHFVETNDNGFIIDACYQNVFGKLNLYLFRRKMAGQKPSFLKKG